MTELRQSVAFLHSVGSGIEAQLRLDTLIVTPRAPGSETLIERLSTSTTLKVDEPIPSILAEEIVADQYSVCLEHIFSHLVWADFRSGENQAGLIAYLLETRHYLQAASFRMSPSASALDPAHPLTNLLVRHVAEEADHARYFESALALLGIPKQLAQSLRPLPATIEWIYLMRTISRRDPLGAALASGLMEQSAAEQASVRGWHEALSSWGFLPVEAAEHLYDHVREDIGLGHGANWRKALETERFVDPARLTRCLNDIAAVSEMIVRWLTSIRAGGTTSAALVAAQGSGGGNDCPSLFSSGVPIWSSNILDGITRSPAAEGAQAAIACAYAGISLDDPGTELAVAATSLRRTLASEAICGTCVDEFICEIKTWTRAIDGHRLWSGMTEKSSAALSEGWLLENYHYLRSSPIHSCAAISSCDDELIRPHLVKHLIEEEEHCEILASSLRKSRWMKEPERARPLPTTIAFTGYLADLALRDWPAYVIALIFLQSTLSSADDVQARFYDAVIESSPDAAPMVQAMKRHDDVDSAASHDADMAALLDLLWQRNHVNPTSIHRAALVPQLVWSFLDGIADHYRWGPAAIWQRVGWSAGIART